MVDVPFSLIEINDRRVIILIIKLGSYKYVTINSKATLKSLFTTVHFKYTAAVYNFEASNTLSKFIANSTLPAECKNFNQITCFGCPVLICLCCTVHTDFIWANHQSLERKNTLVWRLEVWRSKEPLFLWKCVFISSQTLGWQTKPVVDCSEGVRLCQSRALFKPVRSEICRTLSQINCRHGWHQSLEDPAPGCQKKCHTWPVTDGVRLCVSCAILHRLLRSTHVLCQRSDRWGRQWHPALLGMMPTTQVSVSTFFLPSATKLTSSY